MSKLAKYTGRYGKDSPVLAVELRGERLFARTSDREYALTALSATRFRCAEASVYAEGTSATFSIDARGRVTGVAFDDGPELARLK